eukprot:50012-Pyramimonas_sp.AAC.1
MATCPYFGDASGTPRVLGQVTHVQSHEDQPAYHPQTDDGSDRYMVVNCDLVDTAIHRDKGAHARQMVRNILRGCLALACDSEKDYSIGILRAEGIRRPSFSYEEQRHCSEWLATALRRKPLRRGHLSGRFLREVHPLMKLMDGLTCQSCSTIDELKD